MDRPVGQVGLSFIVIILVVFVIVAGELTKLISQRTGQGREGTLGERSRLCKLPFPLLLHLLSGE